MAPITEAIDNADVIILASPIYVYHATGAMKSFLDHYGYRWMPHRPEGKMFNKQAICISTGAGAGMKSTNKDMAHSTLFWGVAKTYKLGFDVNAASWKEVSPKIRKKIDKKTDKLAKKIKKRNGKIRPSLKTKILFFIMRLGQKKGISERDKVYWDEKGWLGKKDLGNRSF